MRYFVTRYYPALSLYHCFDVLSVPVLPGSHIGAVYLCMVVQARVTKCY